MPYPTRLQSAVLLDDAIGVDLNTPAALGGQVRIFTANATTLLVGDIVYLAATAGVVDKSATAANYVGFVGVVVSGDSLGMEPSSTVGTTAATSGQKVMVQIDGIANVICGASTITAGTHFAVVPSAATAGRVLPATIPSPDTAAGQRLGVALTTQSVAGSALKILIQHF